MTRFYSIDDANAALPDVERILLDLRDQRAELIVLRDAVIAAADHGDDASERDSGQAGRGTEPATTPNLAPSDPLRLRLRMQGLIDQMQAGVTRLVERDITLREIETGLIDFPALVNGRQVWLCWRLGEEDIAWWHELGDGFGGRAALADLS
ncbi:MAG: DUF2203 domain-containing protein [Dehalococcoidia bacterium]